MAAEAGSGQRAAGNGTERSSWSESSDYCRSRVREPRPRGAVLAGAAGGVGAPHGGQVPGVSRSREGEAEMPRVAAGGCGAAGRPRAPSTRCLAARTPPLPVLRAWRGGRGRRPEVPEARGPRGGAPVRLALCRVKVSLPGGKGKRSGRVCRGRRGRGALVGTRVLFLGDMVSVQELGRVTRSPFPRRSYLQMWSVYSHF